MFHLINLILFFIIMLFYLSNSLTPLWNFKNSTTDILNGNELKSILIHTSEYYEYTIELTHTFSKSSEEISQKKTIVIKTENNNEFFNGQVEFDDIHSFYRTVHASKYYYFICPKGPNYPLMYENNSWKKIELGTLNEDSNLLCYYHSSADDNTLLFMFSNSNNIYGYSVRNNINYTFTFNNHILDFIVGDNKTNQTMVIAHLHEYQILLETVFVEFNNKNILTNFLYTTIDPNPFSIVQCNFVQLNDNYTLYCLTYDKNSSNFSSGYSSNDIKLIDNKINATYTKNTNIPFQFKNNITIQSIQLIKNTPFAQYIITVDEKDPISEINKKITYFGILDISTNQILFNSNETIKKIYSSNTTTNEYIIITESSVYKLCGTAKEGGNCIQKCSNHLKLNPEDYNTCTNDNSCDTQIYKPYNICISKCDTNLFYSDGTNCGLCKDIDPNNPYTIYGENECKNTTEGLYELYPFVKIFKKCYSTCKNCYGKDSNISHNCESCIQDHYLTDKNCTQECYLSYYKNESTRKCEKCNENCLTCSKGSENGNNYCLSCNNGQLLLNATGYGNNCVDQCPNNTIRKDNYCNEIDEEEERKKKEEEERKKKEEEERKQKEEEERKQKEENKANEESVLVWYIILIVLIIFSIFIIIYLIYMCKPEKLEDVQENIISELKDFKE